MVPENYWRVVDDINNWPVGNPKRRFDEYNKFSLNYETKVIIPVGKSQTEEGDLASFTIAPDNL
jgi:hypothetical protein